MKNTSMVRILTIVFIFLFPVLMDAQLIDYDKIDTARVYKSLETAMANPLQVYRLDLSRKKLKTFPLEILQFTNLNELVLDKNKLDSIPLSIGKLHNLQKLSIYKNYLVNIDFITALPNLVFLDLTSNYIEAIPENINQLQKLRTFILQLNTVTVFPETLQNLVNLDKLNLLDNELNRDQQWAVLNLLPNTEIELSAPCHCNTEDDED